MNLNKLTLISAFITTLAIMLVAALFRYCDEYYAGAENRELFIAGILIVFVTSFFGIDRLLRFYGKRQIQQIAQTLPKQILIGNQNMGFKELSEKISGLNQTNDTMKQMELYRKEYIGNVSHELKTPLFSIQGYVEILQDGAMDNDLLREKYLNRIEISVERLIAIVSDLDMINRFEAGEIVLNISNFEINELVNEIFDLLEFDAKKKNTVLMLQSSQPKIEVSADRQKISQVFINLISNAIYYANRQDTQVLVTTSIIKDKVHIEIQDNGIGIKPEALPRIFERFYRVDTSRSRKEGGGSGLGLAIVKHILEAHNEPISVESEYLNKTKFSFSLKRAVSKLV